MSRFRMLSIDGGGIRGLLPGKWLSALEGRLGASATVASAFDLFAGTSTGAIIAAGLAANAKTTHEISKIYEEKAGEVFQPAPTWQRLSGIAPWFRPGFVATGLANVLREIFADLQLSDVANRAKFLLVTAFDAYNRRPVVFDSSKAEHQKLKLADVCLASSAAPTYFPAHVMEFQGGRTPMLDGGMSANNPAGVALGWALRKKYPREDLFLLSLGTGEVTNHIPVSKARNRGRVQWAKPAIDVLFEGNSGITAEIVESILPNRENYIRFQIRLDKRNGEMADVRRENLEELGILAAGYLEGDGEFLLDQVVKSLTSPRRAGPRPPTLEPDPDPLELVRLARDGLSHVVDRCIAYAEGQDHPEVIREYLRLVADDVPAADCLRVARERFPGNVPFHQRADLLRIAQLRFNSELVKRFTILRRETELLITSITLHGGTKDSLGSEAAGYRLEATP